MVILNFLLFILVLGTIILVHEFGHFYFAKRAGILCHEFSIGMGPALWQKRKGETVYSVRGIPIGGYVAMAGESVSDAMIKIGQTVRLVTNDQGKVTRIVLHDDGEGVIGKVSGFDLYGKNLEPLHIDLEADGTVTRYPVMRDAVYQFSEKREMWITPSEKSFESKTLWERFLVIFAGPFMNFVLALVLFLIVGFFVSKPDLDSNVIDSVSPGLPAETAGIVPGSMLVMINDVDITDWNDIGETLSGLSSPVVDLTYMKNGTETTTQATLLVDVLVAGFSNYVLTDEGIETLVIHSDEPVIGVNSATRARTDGNLLSGDVITALEVGTARADVSSWDDIIAFFRTHDRGDVTVTALRDGETVQGTYALISSDAVRRLGREPIGFTLGVAPEADFDLLYSLAYPFESIYDNTMSVFMTIGLLADRDEDLGFRDLAGPVGIFSLVSDTASQGILAILGFTAFLSINIGLLNLLPIPALDGGRLVFLAIEGVSGRPLNRKVENIVNNAMFFLLLALFVYVTFNDIVRLVKG